GLLAVLASLLVVRVDLLLVALRRLERVVVLVDRGGHGDLVADLRRRRGGYDGTGRVGQPHADEHPARREDDPPLLRVVRAHDPVHAHAAGAARDAEAAPGEGAVPELARREGDALTDVEPLAVAGEPGGRRVHADDVTRRL